MTTRRHRITALLAALVVTACHGDTTPPVGPAQLTFLNVPSSTTVGAMLKPSIQVAIQDIYGNTLPGVTDEVTLTIANNSAGATLSGTTTVKAVRGVATFSDLSIDKAAKQYKLIASSGNIPSIASGSFTITGPSQLVFTSPPSAAPAGATISPPILVAIEDAAGNTVVGATSAVTLSLGTNPAGATLSGTTTVNAVQGVATFSDLSIDKLAAQYTLVASATDLPAVTSPSFAIVGPSKLAFSVAPNGGVVGAVLTPPILVVIQDALGNTVSNATSAVTVSLASNSSGAALGGTTTVNAVRGVATFNDLSISKVGEGYTLTASSGSLTPVTSGAFSVNNGPPALHITTVTTGASIPANFSVSVDCDSYGCLYDSTILPNGALTLAVQPGVHYVTLFVPNNCVVAGDLSRTVTVIATTEVPFSIACGALGTLGVTTTTTGSDITPDGYSVCVDQVGNACYWHADLHPSDRIAITGILAGPHNVTLTNVGGNCTVSGGATHVVTVLGDASVNASFDVSCALTERIAFASGGTISMIHTDGTAKHVITSGAAPAWSPDGGTLAFECSGDICIVNADGTAASRLPSGGGVNRHPEWSPDGTKIVFASSASGTTDLYVTTVVGGATVRLTQGVGVVGNPAWSPDGTRIAFDCQVDAGNLDICIVNADGTGFTRLTTDPARDYGAAWKPDGSAIAFTTMRFGFDEIVLISPTGGSVTRIGGGLAGFTPTWSQDGTQLAFVQLYNDPIAGVQESIVVAHSDGSNARSIAMGAQPAWRPHR